ncbi:hypothetical protein PHYBLDRAFT_71875 [Phycomyces blakesleeanus NRRL 1555(-)]|uniref:Uncharacterized protein n=1 Tax=Phycomyces blakesleeanus (strain ATCC 8743b / DSM 1359 / FGSC 10004 / NBRC 33097 / NRRL 1555) TaxID=763407 RepID=A0A162WF16_PHYB8|nr:hypothetical protein PHYBLDRAFT_71875 [Phycomyces blakesleeanus NRRL 1555(-)]OAD66695.1 hypothetical protein PHYBLDRAFT_71875 [Phycomyces blakesleeanus NRRL 1555(-)]|eukprot:XP_018284735.1 hypothetical protein PHYBLDRAFT_71875 [Phycomyces blakesleeanus NRRL 1555(-)]
MIYKKSHRIIKTFCNTIFKDHVKLNSVLESKDMDNSLYALIKGEQFQSIYLYFTLNLYFYILIILSHKAKSLDNEIYKKRTYAFIKYTPGSPSSYAEDHKKLLPLDCGAILLDISLFIILTHTEPGRVIPCRQKCHDLWSVTLLTVLICPHQVSADRLKSSKVRTLKRYYLICLKNKIKKDQTSLTALSSSAGN